MVSRSENLPIDDQTCRSKVTQVLTLNSDGLIDPKFCPVDNGDTVKSTAHKPDCTSSEAKNKKVKFGTDGGHGETLVETFVYERQPVELYNFRPSSNKPEPPGSPTLLRVEIVEGHVPQQISPPINNEPALPPCPTEASSSSLSLGVASVAQQFNPSPHHVASLTLRAYLDSTPAHHQKNRMDSDENPFRPDGNLSHEVEPIVEVYKHKPFPGSPERHSASLRTPSPAAGPAHDLPDSVPVSGGKKPASQPKKQQAEHVVRLEPDRLVSCATAAPPSDAGSPNSNGRGAQEAEVVQQRLLAPSKAQTPQVVHLPAGGQKRKKCCGSCSVQ